MLFLNKLRDENFNIILLNNFMILYCISLLVSYRISGTIFYVMLLIFLLNNNLKNLFFESLNNKVIQAFVLYFILHALWVIGSENLENALFQLRKNIILLSPILFYPIVKKEYIEKIFLYFVIVIFFSSIISIMMYFDLIQINNTISGESIPFLYKSDYGFFLLIAIGYSFYNISYIKKELLVKKIFFQFSIIILSFNIFIIGSRTFMLIYIFAIGFLIISVYRKYIFKAIISIIVIINILLVVYFNNIEIKNQLDEIYNGLKKSYYEKEYTNSSGVRSGLIEYSIPVIKDNFLFGVGTGDHIDEVKKEIQKSPDYEIEKDGKYKYLLKSINIGFSSFLHNTYIQTLVQFGILGFIIWLNMFYQIIKIEKSVNLHKKLTNYIVIMYLLICIAGAELMYQNLGKMLLLIFSLLIYNKNDKILNTN
ncbi:O-antigen ligase family protein [Aliarcobacter cryaerophilus]|jgi:O-antigen ligase|uniref:O-antigen ligase family protein n=1 Tax=Aliarcobacter cryaerophilus TaxID=28198 RepID=UPI003DA4AA81